MDKTILSTNLEEINKKGMTKAFITEKILNLVLYINLIVSLFYNSILIFFLRNTLNSSTKIDEDECEILFSWAQTILIWATICLINSLLFFCCLRCGGEEDTTDSNDCNIICLFLKSITSYIPAIVFNYKLGSLIEKAYFNESCISMNTILQNFKSFEYYYVVWITSLLLMVPTAMILAGLKEIWKSRK